MITGVALQAAFNVANELTPTGLRMLTLDGQIGPASRKAFALAESRWGAEWWLRPTPAPRYMIDSFGIITAKLLEKLKKDIGTFPVLAGRYLGGVQSAEVQALAAVGCSLVLVDNHPTNAHVITGSQKQGEAEGARAATLAKATRALGSNVSDLVFLDVEMEPNVSDLFYIGWAHALKSEGFRPAVYLPNFVNWPASWHAVRKAVDLGAACEGTWSAKYVLPSDGSARFLRTGWDQAEAGGPFGPNLLWQYIGNAYDKSVDFSCFNPGASLRF